MSKKLAAKSALIALPLPNRGVPAGDAESGTLPRTRTAVGGMAQFVATQSPIHREAEALRKVVEGFDGARMVRAISPASVVPSQWANRHDDSFESADFAELKREIQEAGGNVQPIKVRPLSSSSHGAANGAQYEIVFGHRRHRACLELNIPVNALIESVDDQMLFEQMERENRGRKNLSAWEQGCMYQAALDKGLYPSQRKLSESIGVDISLISKSLALAKLPKAVINAFPSPLDVQYRWAQPLRDALQRDHAGVIARAQAICVASKTLRPSAVEVFARLTRAHLEKSVGAGQSVVLEIAGERAGEWVVDARGAVTLKFSAGKLSQPRRAELLAAIQAFLTAV